MRAAALALLLVWLPVAALADAAFARLWDLTGMDAYIDITQAEGVEDIDRLAADMLPGPPSEGFRQQMMAIYDRDRLRETVYSAMQTHLDESDVSSSLILFESDVGQRIVELEVAARRAMTDSDLEAAARAAWEEMQDGDPELLGQIRRFIEINRLIERNVTGALNSQLRFYQGLADGGALDLTEQDILAEVAAQEEEMRADSANWLGGYLLLALQPLGEDDVEDYLQFWETGPGRALNAALFDAFNQVYDEIAYATGRVVALHMGMRDL